MIAGHADQGKRKYAHALLPVWVALILGAMNIQGAAGNETPPDLEAQLELIYGDSKAQDIVAQQRYEKEGAEIIPPMKQAALARMDNAALFYYQAFLLRPQSGEGTSLAIEEVLRGAEPDGRIRAHLGHCREMIHVAELAAQMPQCDWGLRRPDGTHFTPELPIHTRHLTFVLAVDARTLVVDGHYQAALTRCLTMRRIAHHVSAGGINAGVLSISIDGMAGNTMQHVLGSIPPDDRILSWLRDRLGVVSGTWSLTREALQEHGELILDNMQGNRALLNEIRQHRTAVDVRGEPTPNLTDEELVAGAREPLAKFLSSVGRITDSSMNQAQKYTEIEGLVNELEATYGADPLVGRVILRSGARQIPEWFALSIRSQARFDAIRAAIEIYLLAARSGHLPKTLPTSVPKDPFSGEDFGYEITADGFVLRCRAGDPRSGKVWEYEFQVCD